MFLEKELQIHYGNISEVARITGVNRRSIHRLVDKTISKVKQFAQSAHDRSELNKKNNEIQAEAEKQNLKTEKRKGTGFYHVDNLYVAGSSVFPTGGYANPTLTIIQLTLRLADHISLRLA